MIELEFTNSWLLAIHLIIATIARTKNINKSDKTFAIVVHERTTARFRQGSAINVKVIWLAWLLVIYHVRTAAHSNHCR